MQTNLVNLQTLYQTASGEVPLIKKQWIIIGPSFLASYN